ncbi:PaaI family thioesterase [Cysteiniphilum halobium]|uniref:PaaI family thioesterase n=1 Tax=Cysteiniphilum halobium TaxID=2219059 RepID=UPI003F85E425
MIKKSDLTKVNFPLERACFGCSPNNHLGLKLEFYLDSNRKMFSFYKPNPHHVSWGKIIHGGISATILDEISGWIVMFSKKMMCVTSTFEIKYHAPIVMSDEYIVTGKIIDEQNKSIIVESEILDNQDKIYVSSTAKLITLSPRRARMMEIISPEDYDQLEDFFKTI